MPVPAALGAHTLPTPGTPPRTGPRDTLGTFAVLNRAEACPDLGSTLGHREPSAACVCWGGPGQLGSRALRREEPAVCCGWARGGPAWQEGVCVPGGEPARSWREPMLRPQADKGVGRGCSPRSSWALPVRILGSAWGSRHVPLTPSTSRHRGLIGSLEPGPCPPHRATLRDRPPCGTGQPVPRPRCCSHLGRWGEARGGREEKGLWLGPRPRETSAAQGTCLGLFPDEHGQERLPAGRAARGWAPGWVALGRGPHPPEPVGDGLTPQGCADRET